MRDNICGNYGDMLSPCRKDNGKCRSEEILTKVKKTANKNAGEEAHRRRIYFQQSWC